MTYDAGGAQRGEVLGGVIDTYSDCVGHSDRSLTDSSPWSSSASMILIHTGWASTSRRRPIHSATAAHWMRRASRCHSAAFRARADACSPTPSAACAASHPAIEVRLDEAPHSQQLDRLAAGQTGPRSGGYCPSTGHLKYASRCATRSSFSPERIPQNAFRL